MNPTNFHQGEFAFIPGHVPPLTAATSAWRWGCCRCSTHLCKSPWSPPDTISPGVRRHVHVADGEGNLRPADETDGISQVRDGEDTGGHGSAAAWATLSAGDVMSIRNNLAAPSDSWGPGREDLVSPKGHQLRGTRREHPPPFASSSLVRTTAQTSTDPDAHIREAAQPGLVRLPTTAGSLYPVVFSIRVDLGSGRTHDQQSQKVGEHYHGGGDKSASYDLCFTSGTFKGAAS